LTQDIDQPVSYRGAVTRTGRHTAFVINRDQHSVPRATPARCVHPGPSPVVSHTVVGSVCQPRLRHHPALLLTVTKTGASPTTANLARPTTR